MSAVATRRASKRLQPPQPTPEDAAAADQLDSSETEDSEIEEAPRRAKRPKRIVRHVQAMPPPPPGAPLPAPPPQTAAEAVAAAAAAVRAAPSATAATVSAAASAAAAAARLCPPPEFPRPRPPPITAVVNRAGPGGAQQPPVVAAVNRAGTQRPPVPPISPSSLVLPPPSASVRREHGYRSWIPLPPLTVLPPEIARGMRVRVTEFYAPAPMPRRLVPVSMPLAPRDSYADHACKSNRPYLWPVYTRGESLMLALQKGDFHTVRMMVSQGKVDPNYGEQTGNGTPLCLAVEMSNDDDEKSVEGIRTMIALGANVDAIGPHGMTALELACRNGRFRAVSLLLQNGATIVRSPEAMVAAFVWLINKAVAGNHVHLATFQALLESGFDLTKQSADGTTVVHYAATSGKRFLLEQFWNFVKNTKPETMGVLDNRSRTPLMRAAYAGHAETVFFLLSTGYSNPRHRCHVGWNVLHVAVMGSWKDLSPDATFHPSDVITPILIEARCLDVDTQDNNGHTPLHHALMHRNFSHAARLIVHGSQYGDDTVVSFGMRPLLDYAYPHVVVEFARAKKAMRGANACTITQSSLDKIGRIVDHNRRAYLAQSGLPPLPLPQPPQPPQPAASAPELLTMAQYRARTGNLQQLTPQSVPQPQAPQQFPAVVIPAAAATAAGLVALPSPVLSSAAPPPPLLSSSSSSSSAAPLQPQPQPQPEAKSNNPSGWMTELFDIYGGAI